MENQSLREEPLKQSTLLAWRRILDPLVELLFDTGVTVKDVTRLVGERAVRAAAARVRKECGRDSKSRIAIMTGLSRSEVARILSAEDTSAGRRVGQHPSGRVLAAWYESSAFLSPDGEPAILPIFGRRRSFEKLVLLNSGGIPVRAMLDQLVQIDAVEILAGQHVRPKSRVPVFRGLSASAIARIGERAADLIETLRCNLRATSNPLFEGTASLGSVDLDLVPLIRREIEEQSANLIETTNALFNRSRRQTRRSNHNVQPACRIGVTLYYFQSEPTGGEGSNSGGIGRRKNLQRKIRISKRKGQSLPSRNVEQSNYDK